MSSDKNDNFEPLVVLHLSPSTPAATKQWIIRRLTASHDEDEGAGLLARFEPNPENHVKLFFFVLRKINFWIL
jgi:hypothetical protein